MEIPRRPFQHGQQVRIISGPFSHFDAIFEGYLSGSKRLRFLSLPSRDARARGRGRGKHRNLAGSSSPAHLARRGDGALQSRFRIFF